MKEGKTFERGKRKPSYEGRRNLRAKKRNSFERGKGKTSGEEIKFLRLMKTYPTGFRYDRSRARTSPLLPNSRLSKTTGQFFQIPPLFKLLQQIFG